MERIEEFLNEIKPGVDFKKERALISDGILASFDVVTLVARLNDEFDIEIGVSDIVPENFETLAAIEGLVKKLS
jgi:hypothetical protein